MPVILAEPAGDATATETDEGTEYRLTVNVESDNVNDGPRTILSSPYLPGRYTPYANVYGSNDVDNNSFLVDRNPKRNDKRRKRWAVDLTWKPQVASQEQPGGSGHKNVNAQTIEIARTDINVSYAQYQEPIRDAHWISNSDGSALWVGNDSGPIINTALQAFVPAPEKPYAYRIIKISRVFEAYGDFDPTGTAPAQKPNTSLFCPDLDKYILSTNNAKFSIVGNDFVFSGVLINNWIAGGGQGPIPALDASILNGNRNFQVNADQYQSLINDVQVEDVEEKPYTGRVFKKVTIEFWIDKRRGFRRKFRSRGFAERRMPGDFDPTDPTGTVSAAKFPNGKPSAHIVDDRGHPIRVPADLDKDGQDCRRTGQPKVDMTWAVQSELDHRPVLDIFFCRGEFYALAAPVGLIIP